MKKIKISIFLNLCFIGVFSQSSNSISTLTIDGKEATALSCYSFGSMDILVPYQKLSEYPIVEICFDFMKDGKLMESAACKQFYPAEIKNNVIENNKVKINIFNKGKQESQNNCIIINND